MKVCDHNSTRENIITRELSGHTFTAEAAICTDCGAELWDEGLNIRFNKWLSSLSTKPRIQFKISERAEKCLGRILLNLPGANKAIVVRAMTAVYLDFLKRGPEVNDMFNQISESDVYNSLVDDVETKAFQTDVRAIFFFDIQSWGKIFSLKPNEMAYEAFHLMLALYISEDAELKDFWTTEILPEIERIIKAA